MRTASCSHSSPAGFNPSISHLSPASRPFAAAGWLHLSHSHAGNVDFLPSSVGGDVERNARSGRIKLGQTCSERLQQQLPRDHPAECTSRLNKCGNRSTPWEQKAAWFSPILHKANSSFVGEDGGAGPPVLPHLPPIGLEGRPPSPSLLSDSRRDQCSTHDEHVCLGGEDSIDSLECAALPVGRRRLLKNTRRPLALPAERTHIFLSHFGPVY